MKNVFMDSGVVYPLEQLENDIEKIIHSLAEIRADRGKKYGGEFDTLQNVREADPNNSWRGAYTSAVECLNRLKNLYFKRMEEWDHDDLANFYNATDDLINYVLYIKILGVQKMLSIPNKCERGDCD